MIDWGLILVIITQGMGIVFVLMLTIIVALAVIRYIADYLERRAPTTTPTAPTPRPPQGVLITDKRTHAVIAAAVRLHLHQ